MQRSSIEWTDYVWNVTTGCNGPNGVRCPYCYMVPISRRFHRSFAPTCHPERLDQPLRLKKPARIFVDSAGDLFDPAIPDEFVAEVFAVMAAATDIDHDHTMIVLTKQAARMQGLCSSPEFVAAVCDCARAYTPYDVEWPLPNAHLGVTVTNHRDADERIALLLQTPASVRFVSVEPLLGPVDLGLSTATCNCCERWPSRWVRLPKVVAPDWPLITQLPDGIAKPGVYRAESNRHGALSVHTPSGLLGIKPAEFAPLPSLDWVIVGAQTGPGAKPPEPEWVQSLIDQCKAAGVPLFLKENLLWVEQIKEYPR